MNSVTKFVLAFGIILTVAGMAGAGWTYRDMKTQNILHARQGSLQLNLGYKPFTEEETFAFYQAGEHIIYLTTADPFSKPRGNVPKEDSLFSGILNVTVTDPSGKEYYKKDIVSDSLRVIQPNSVEWIPIDTLQVREPFEGIWKITAHVVKPDSNFSDSFTEMFIMPPQHYNIGMYLYGQTFKLIGWALLMLVGFVTIVVGGFFVRRATESTS